MQYSVAPMEKLGLPIGSVDGALRLLPDKKICHGFQNGCMCKAKCSERHKKPKRPNARVRQPWEVAA